MMKTSNHEERVRAIIKELGGPTNAAFLAGQSRKRIYRWLRNGDLPGEDIRAIITNSNRAGRPVPVSLLLGLPPEQITV